MVLSNTSSLLSISCSGLVDRAVIAVIKIMDSDHDDPNAIDDVFLWGEGTDKGSRGSDDVSSGDSDKATRGSDHDDPNAIDDVFLWGEGTGDGILGGGQIGNSSSIELDSLVPKALEFPFKHAVQNISCGSRHVAFVTKEGDIYSWGVECGGRLGHRRDCDVFQPKLVEALTNMNIELVKCGEFRTCAVTLSGDLYTWGDGSHWVPKRVTGPLEGKHVSSVSCGNWHTAVVTAAGQLFTFGDGNFGVLGHGDQESVSLPREVESLKGLRTVQVACGAWHTAAVVEVIHVGNSSSSDRLSGKLFTWGNGDTWRLGHGDRERKLIPTCVTGLVEQNCFQVACGDSLTVALTTSGHVYTMGLSFYGELGNPHADGKLPVRVQEKLLNEFVDEISCGAYHVAVLTSKTEVYTWGKGSNGRLGHGDNDNRNTPTLVDALKDKKVRSVVCGISFTAAICLHKRESGVKQSKCSGCRLPFNFRRRRHRCYNCALIFCHSCSSRKSIKASMAPNLDKPYRICYSCFNKLAGAVQSDISSHTSSYSWQGFVDLTEKEENFVIKQVMEESEAGEKRKEHIDEKVASSKLEEQDELDKKLHESTRQPEVLSKDDKDSNTTNISIFSYSDLQHATSDFSDSKKLGEGGFGSVYKGYIDGTVIAIKKLNCQGDANQEKAFRQELKVLGKVRHPHLIRLLGVCEEMCILVYEFMDGGTLEDRLASKDFLWHDRIRIAAEICSSLLFLHNHEPDIVVHGDLKPANIFLNAKGASVLGDFGICRIIPPSNTTTTAHITATNLQGSHGYIDPALLQTCKLQPSIDVYAFGMILLRLVTNKQAAYGLIGIVEDAMEDNSLGGLLDPTAQWPTQLAEDLAELAVSCCNYRARLRPALAKVLEELEEMKKASSTVSPLAQ